MNKIDIAKQQSDFIFYTSNEGDVNVEVFLKDETVWLTQKGISRLFGVNVPAISKHLANIYETGELRKKSTISILETVQNEGDRKVRRKMELHIMKNSLTNQQQRFLLYTSADGNIHVDVVLQDETVWLTQKAMGLLFGVESHTITYHLKEIFKSGELDEKATTRKIRAVQNEGKRQVTRG